MSRRQRRQKQRAPHVDKYAAKAAAARANPTVVVRGQVQVATDETPSSDNSPTEEEKVS